MAKWTDVTQSGYDKAMDVMKHDTYMYSTGKRLIEVQGQIEDYDDMPLDFKHGVMTAVYDMFRC